MRSKKTNHKTPSFSIGHLALVLLCLVLFTTRLTSGVAAKFASNTTASGSAQVIRFGEISIEETGDFNAAGKLFIIPGVDINKSAQVNFEGSEAATYVFLEVKLAGWETENYRNFSVSRDSVKLLSWDVSSDWTYLKSSGDTYVYYYLGEMLPFNTEVHSKIIADDTIHTSTQVTAAHIAAGVFDDLSITFRATAVQGNGFGSALIAWASVSAKGGQ